MDQSAHQRLGAALCLSMPRANIVYVDQSVRQLETKWLRVFVRVRALPAPKWSAVLLLVSGPGALQNEGAFASQS